MKRGLLVLLAICAFAIAMVPKDRRAVNSEEQKETPKAVEMVCQSHTPCAWFAYKIHVGIEYNVTNAYCVCGSGTSCVKDEDDVQASVLVFRCREPGHGEKKDDD